MDLVGCDVSQNPLHYHFQHTEKERKLEACLDGALHCHPYLLIAGAGGSKFIDGI
jgi:hypothetical protein